MSARHFAVQVAEQHPAASLDGASHHFVSPAAHQMSEWISRRVCCRCLPQYVFVRLVQALLCRAEQHHMTVHFFFLSVGSASNHLLQALCDDGEAGPPLKARVPALLHQLLHGIRHRLPKPAAQLPASSALPARAGHVRLPIPAPFHITWHLLPCIRSNVTDVNQHKGQKERIGLKSTALLHQIFHCIRVSPAFQAAWHPYIHASSISPQRSNS